MWSFRALAELIGAGVAILDRSSHRVIIVAGNMADVPRRSHDGTRKFFPIRFQARRAEKFPGSVMTLPAGLVTMAT
jgi:hypothetical protein